MIVISIFGQGRQSCIAGGYNHAGSYVYTLKSLQEVYKPRQAYAIYIRTALTSLRALCFGGRPPSTSSVHFHKNAQQKKKKIGKSKNACLILYIKYMGYNSSRLMLIIFSEPPPEGGLDLVTNRQGAI